MYMLEKPGLLHCISPVSRARLSTHRAGSEHAQACILILTSCMLVSSCMNLCQLTYLHYHAIPNRSRLFAKLHCLLVFKHVVKVYTKRSNVNSSLYVYYCRGQVIRVRAPWIKNYMNNNGQFYIIPNFETVVLGGTTQKGNYDITISPQVSLVCLSSGQGTFIAVEHMLLACCHCTLCCRMTDSKV